MHEYFLNDSKQNTVMADQLCCHACPEHRCLCAPYAFERVFNANSCSGDYKIDADVTEVSQSQKNPAQRLGSFSLTEAVV